MQLTSGSEGFLCNVCIVVDIILLHFCVLCDCDKTVTLEMLLNTKLKISFFIFTQMRPSLNLGLFIFPLKSKTCPNDLLTKDTIKSKLLIFCTVAWNEASRR